MAVTPGRLKSISAHTDNAHQSERLRPQRTFRVLVHVSHDVDLSLAARTRTTSSQLFQRDVTFRAIVPANREFFTNLLNIQRLHRSSLSTLPCLRPSSRCPSAWLHKY